MRQFAPFFKEQPPSFQLFIFLFLLLFGALTGMLVGLGLLQIIPGVSVSDLQDSSGQQYIIAARIIQISSQLGLFLFPPLAWAFLFTHNCSKALGWHQNFTYQSFVPAILLMFAALPFIHWLAEINHLIHFPESMSALEQWLIDKEADAQRLTEVFLSGKTYQDLMINLFMIAIIPAVGEELVFRSVLQPLLGKLFRNIHLGVIVASLVFSLMHFQFFGLLPRFMLGLFLGYFYLWSGSIFVPIIMHFVNNGAAVLIYFLHINGYIDVPMEDFGATEKPVYLIVSILSSFGLLLAGKLFSERRHQ